MKKFEEEVKRPSNAGIDPFSKRDISFEKLSSKFTKGTQTLKEWKEYAFKAEDRIRELESQIEKQQPEITGFEEEFDNLMRAFVDYHDCFDFDTEKCYLELKKEFIEKYGKKQQPELPEFVAEFITKLKKANNDLTFAFSSRVNECPAKYWNEAIVWRFNHPEEFAQAWVNGYTVKQKRFYLKHIDFCKRDKYYDRYIIKYDSGVLNHLRIEKGVLPQNVDTYFTQQEIDSMETGSYERIEVEE